MFRLIAVVLLFFSHVSFAETIPATNNAASNGPATATGQYRVARNDGTFITGTNPSDICNQRSAGGVWDGVQGNSTAPQWVNSGNCTNNATYWLPLFREFTCATGTWNGNTCVTQQFYSCPTGQNWTLSGSNCTRPDCVAPQVRNATTGMCEAPADPCAASAGPAGGGWYSFSKGTSGSVMDGNYCAGGCAVGLSRNDMSGNGDAYFTDTTISIYMTKTNLGYTCTNGMAPAPTAAPSSAQPSNPPANPPCAAGQGVMTSTSGNVRCVPAGTPQSSTPKVQYENFKKSFPDGSTATTERTTTTDPATGANHTADKVTVTSATGGGAGQAGPVGTTTTGGSAATTQSPIPATGQPDKSDSFCAQNPNSQICKGGMAEEATLKQVRDLLNPTEAKPNTEMATEKGDFEQKANEHKTFIESFGQKAQSDEGGLLSWAFIPEVPPSDCPEMAGTVMGYSVNFNLCGKFAMVRELAGWALYMVTIFGLFRIITGSNAKEA